MALAIANPIMAAFRPAPDSSRRIIFNWAHRIVGIVSLIMAFVNICSGIDLPSSSFAPVAAKYVMYGFLGFHGIIQILLAVERCKWGEAKDGNKSVAPNDKNEKDFDMANKAAAAESGEGGDDGKGECYKMQFPLLVVFVVGGFGFWLAMFILFIA